MLTQHRLQSNYLNSFKELKDNLPKKWAKETVNLKISINLIISEQRENRLNITEWNFRDLQNNIQRSNKIITEVPEGEKKKEAEKVTKIMAEDFLNL